ncbi:MULTISPECIES: GntR family transcriptional regulator [Oceanotoga]|jgi:GntR family transcriptional regulator|uniref:GntR family transcriptional regulator n=1 Tax=Oceanotoga teriensis TaxID=515440 RepID=A0AA45C4F5_9BACT|nr:MULTISPECIES: GntR family transcriptional regulator [Oceanotoga]MDN5342751.1 GntR family transcriptional regulator [Oceanotoga sp.]MDO7975775.1 GntR family transcriptional regulator [Oceanotoga teriensis]PWJ85149.1 GntR family transcriptional regulator [Oceanotoga teriensis]
MVFKINKSDEPLSILAREKIKDYIDEKNLKTGDKLPSESNFVKMLGVSRITIREALSQLKQEGIIYTIQGKGTFIKRTPVNLKSGLEVLKSVTEIMETFKYKPSTEYLDRKIVIPEKEIKEKLRLEDGEMVVTYYRKRLADNQMAVYAVDSIPLRFFENKPPQKLPTESMIEFFEDYLKFDLENAVSEIVPVIFDKKMCKILNIKEQNLFMLLNQVFYDSHGIPLIYSLDYFNTEVFKFFINRKRIKK